MYPLERFELWKLSVTDIGTCKQHVMTFDTADLPLQMIGESEGNYFGCELWHVDGAAGTATRVA